MLQFNELDASAGVAELADAQDLGSCGLKTVEVPSSLSRILFLSDCPKTCENPHRYWLFRALV
jgi:hypothetical protein